MAAYPPGHYCYGGVTASVPSLPAGFAALGRLGASFIEPASRRPLQLPPPAVALGATAYGSYPSYASAPYATGPTYPGPAFASASAPAPFQPQQFYNAPPSLSLSSRAGGGGSGGYGALTAPAAPPPPGYHMEQQQQMAPAGEQITAVCRM